MKRYSQKDIREMAEILKNDGVISVPTDTVYGVCARMDSRQAQENLRTIKHRPETKAFPLMCADIDQIRTIAEVSSEEETVIEAFMPGPLTIILKKKESVPEWVNGGMETVAVRMATSGALRDLIRETGSPLYMTSANLSGEPECRSLDEIEKSCPGLDGMMEGDVSFGEASTIVSLRDGLKILRQGPITEEEILRVLKDRRTL